MVARIGRVTVIVYVSTLFPSMPRCGVVIQHLYRPESEVLDRLRDVKEASRYLAGILRDAADILLLGAIP
jgi:hypothetical protein